MVMVATYDVCNNDVTLINIMMRVLLTVDCRQRRSCISFPKIASVKPVVSGEMRQSIVQL